MLQQSQLQNTKITLDFQWSQIDQQPRENFCSSPSSQQPATWQLTRHFMSHVGMTLKTVDVKPAGTVSKNLNWWQWKRNLGVEGKVLHFTRILKSSVCFPKRWGAKHVFALGLYVLTLHCADFQASTSSSKSFAGQGEAMLKEGNNPLRTFKVTPPHNPSSQSSTSLLIFSRQLLC